MPSALMPNGVTDCAYRDLSGQQQSLCKASTKHPDSNQGDGHGTWHPRAAASHPAGHTAQNGTGCLASQGCIPVPLLGLVPEPLAPPSQLVPILLP